MSPVDDDFERDFLWQEKFKEHYHEIAQLVHRFEVASLEDDWRRNTDFTLSLTVPLPRGPIRFAARARRHDYAKRYGRQFTIRLRRPNNTQPEIDKLMQGWGHFLIYGFEAEPDSDRLGPWFIGNLDILRDYIRQGGYYEVRRNKGERGSWLAAFHLDDMPLGFMLNSQGIVDVDRTDVWGSCRNSNWQDPNKPQRLGFCYGDYVMPLTDDLSPGDGYWRQCLVCGFRWRAGWVMPLAKTNQPLAGT